MQYYRHYIGDFSRKTSHLSLAETGAYRKLLDHYYALEKPLPSSLDALCRIVGAQSDVERQAVKNIADTYFPLNGDGARHNNRADEEIRKAQQAIDKMREAGYEGASKRWGKEPDRAPHGSPNRVTIEEPSSILHPLRTKEPTTSKALSGKPDLPPNGRDYRAEAKDVLDYLNRATGRGYRYVDSNLAPIV